MLTNTLQDPIVLEMLQKIHQGRDVRREKVATTKARIRRESYESDSKLSVALGRMIDEVVEIDEARETKRAA